MSLQMNDEWPSLAPTLPGNLIFSLVELVSHAPYFFPTLYNLPSSLTTDQLTSLTSYFNREASRSNSLKLSTKKTYKPTEFPLFPPTTRYEQPPAIQDQSLPLVSGIYMVNFPFSPVFSTSFFPLYSFHQYLRSKFLSFKKKNLS